MSSQTPVIFTLEKPPPSEKLSSKERLLFWARLPSTWLFFIILLSFVYLLQIFSPLRLNTDVVTLLSVGQSVAQGRGYLTYGQPTVFPPAYPSLLAILLWLGWAHPGVIVGINIALLGCGLLTLRYTLRSAFGLSQLDTLQIITFTLLSFVLIKHVTLALTDIAFFAVALVSVAIMVKANRSNSLSELLRWLVLAFLSVVLALITRRNGIALIPAFAWLIFSNKLVRRWFVKARLLSKATAALAVLLAFTSFVKITAATSSLRDVEETHGPRITPALVAEAVGYRVVEAGELTLNVPTSKAPAKIGRIVIPAVGLIIFGLIAKGFIHRRQIRPVDIFFLFYTAILMAWPYYDARFWITIVPFGMAYVTLALRDQVSGPWTIAKGGYKIGFAVMGAVALVYTTHLTFSGPQFGALDGGGIMKNSYCAAFSNCVATSVDDRRAADLLKAYR